MNYNVWEVYRRLAPAFHNNSVYKLISIAISFIDASFQNKYRSKLIPLLPDVQILVCVQPFPRLVFVTVSEVLYCTFPYVLSHGHFIDNYFIYGKEDIR